MFLAVYSQNFSKTIHLHHFCRCYKC